LQRTTTKPLSQLAAGSLFGFWVSYLAMHCAAAPDCNLGANVRACPHVGKGEKHFNVQASVAQSSVERFDIAILDRPPGPNKVYLHARLISPGLHCRLPTSVPLSTVIEARAPRSATTTDNAIATFSPVNELSANIIKHSRVN
jgi:hypothetical protein